MKTAAAIVAAIVLSAQFIGLYDTMIDPNFSSHLNGGLELFA